MNQDNSSNRDFNEQDRKRGSEDAQNPQINQGGRGQNPMNNDRKKGGQNQGSQSNKGNRDQHLTDQERKQGGDNYQQDR